MSIGLDLGSSELRSLRSDSRRLVARRCATNYIALPAIDAQRRLLDQAKIKYVVSDGKLLVVNHDAEELSRLFHVPCDHVLPEGRIPRNDPISRQLISMMLDSLLPGSSTIESCVITVPGGHANISDNAETDYFSLLLRLKGYFPIPIHAAHALTLAKLGDQKFTGIGFIMGAATTEISVVHQGRELAYASVPQGGNWLDEEIGKASDHYAWDLNGQRFLDLESVRRWKHDPNLSLACPMNDAEEILVERYRVLVRSVLEGLVPQIGQQEKRLRSMINGPVNMIVGGGPTRMTGFSNLLEKILGEHALPVKIDQVCYDTDSDWTISRGCLIHAELETEYAQTFAA